MNTDNIEKLPKTITQKMYVHLRISGYGAGNFFCGQCDISEDDQDLILIATQDVTFNLPQNIDVKGKVIESLKAEKEKIQVVTHMKIKDIQDKIDNLLAIEYKS